MSEDKEQLNKPKTSVNLALELADDIQQIAEIELGRTPHDDAPLGETNTYEIDRIKLELADIQRTQTEAKDIHDLRKAYVFRLFLLILGWLFATAVFLTLAGLHAWGFSLSDKVLIALITSTTANVLGLFYVVAKWLYPSPSAKEARTRKITAEISSSGDGQH